jgi:hypothetical protein
MPRRAPFARRAAPILTLAIGFQGKYAIPAVDAADDTIVEALLAGDMASMQDEDDR